MGGSGRKIPVFQELAGVPENHGQPEPMKHVHRTTRKLAISSRGGVRTEEPYAKKDMVAAAEGNVTRPEVWEVAISAAMTGYGLTQAEERMVVEFLRCGRAGKAAKAAGISDKHGRNILARGAVKACLEVCRRAVSARLLVSAEQINGRLAQIGFSDNVCAKDALLQEGDWEMVEITEKKTGRTYTEVVSVGAFQKAVRALKALPREAKELIRRLDIDYGREKISLMCDSPKDALELLSRNLGLGEIDPDAPGETHIIMEMIEETAQGALPAAREEDGDVTETLEVDFSEAGDVNLPPAGIPSLPPQAG